MWRVRSSRAIGSACLLSNIIAPHCEQVVSLYWRSQYWAVSTILTVGYGDVRAVRDDEVGFATFVILSG